MDFAAWTGTPTGPMWASVRSRRSRTCGWTATDRLRACHPLTETEQQLQLANPNAVTGVWAGPDRAGLLRGDPQQLGASSYYRTRRGALPPADSPAHLASACTSSRCTASSTPRSRPVWRQFSVSRLRGGHRLGCPPRHDRAARDRVPGRRQRSLFARARQSGVQRKSRVTKADCSDGATATNRPRATPIRAATWEKSSSRRGSSAPTVPRSSDGRSSGTLTHGRPQTGS